MWPEGGGTPPERLTAHAAAHFDNVRTALRRVCYGGVVQLRTRPWSAMVQLLQSCNMLTGGVIGIARHCTGSHLTLARHVDPDVLLNSDSDTPRSRIR